MTATHYLEGASSVTEGIKVDTTWCRVDSCTLTGHFGRRLWKRPLLDTGSRQQHPDYWLCSQQA